MMACRPVLLELRFGWVNFKCTKGSKFFPGFVHHDGDGIQRAQKVTGDGYVTDRKYEFFEFSENVPDDRKDKTGISALKKLNRKFHFSLV